MENVIDFSTVLRILKILDSLNLSSLFLAIKNELPKITLLKSPLNLKNLKWENKS